MDKDIEEYLDKLNNLEKEEVAKAVIIKFIPSMKQLFRTLRKKGHFIDTQSKSLKGLIRKAYKLRADGFSASERFAYFNIIAPVKELQEKINNLETLQKGSLVYCNDPEFGNGVVTKIYSDGELMRVNFGKRDFDTMCSVKQMTTIHDEVKRPLHLILTSKQ